MRSGGGRFALAAALGIAALAPPLAAEDCPDADPAAALVEALDAADGAFLAGDEEEAGRRLTVAASLAGDLLSPSERLLLARLAEARGDGRAAILQYGHVLAALMRRGESGPEWIGERIRRLDALEEARRLHASSFPPPSKEARTAFAAGRAAAQAGKEREAREKLRRALALSPGYAEAALALGALEARAGRRNEAIAAYRAALDADPERSESLARLSRLLWDEPDRAAKEEALLLLDRAAALDSATPALLRESAERRSEWGEPAKALERLDAYRSRVPEAEARATDGLRERLRSALAAVPPVTGGPPRDDAASPAFETWRIAQVLARRGDDLSLDSAEKLLSEALRLDAAYAPAALLSAEIAARRGDDVRAERELRRATELDPSRATAWEKLAELVARDPKRAADATALWERAEASGSGEALFRLAVAARDAGNTRRARTFLERYLLEASDGPHAAEARERLFGWQRSERLLTAGSVLGAVLLFGTFAWAAIRRRTGDTLASFLAREPGAAPELRPAIGRLRHELFKHGRRVMALSENGLLSADPSIRHEEAGHLLGRLFGAPPAGKTRVSAGLVREAQGAIGDLKAAVSARGGRLNLARPDAELGAVSVALGRLARVRGLVGDEAGGRSLAGRRRTRLLMALAEARAAFDPATGLRLAALLDTAASTRVEFGALESLLAGEARSLDVARPAFVLRSPAHPDALPRVRMARADWDTIWRNLFANAAALGRGRDARETGLALSAQAVRDATTGEARIRLRLFDAFVEPLTVAEIRERPEDRGLGVVRTLVARNDGILDVEPAEAPWRKAILLDLPAIEEDGS